MPSALPLTGAGNSQKNQGPRCPPPRLLGPLCSASLGNRRMSICRGAQCTRGGAYTMAPRWHRVWHERAGVSSEHMVSLLGVRVSHGHRIQRDHCNTPKSVLISVWRNTTPTFLGRMCFPHLTRTTSAVAYAIAHAGGVSVDCKQANATTFRQWRSWLRGAATIRTYPQCPSLLRFGQITSDTERCSECAEKAPQNLGAFARWQKGERCD